MGREEATVESDGCNTRTIRVAVNHTGRFIAKSRLFSSTSLTSDRRKCLREGYRIHHTSLGGRCFAAEAMNAAAILVHT